MRPSDEPAEPDEFLENLVMECLDAADPEAELRRRTVGQPDLHRRALPLLRRVAKQERVTWPAAPAPDPASPVRTSTAGAAPAVIGRYKVLSEIGTGGMGVVYLAEEKEPVRRRVALKVIKLGMDTKAVLARFAAEQQALARMDHSSIAKVLDAGITADGRPYFAMEYVKGIAIARYCDEQRLPIEERLRLFRQVCSGVQHAHQKGVIHRDLTANNVLVTLQDGAPLAKIIDFGLARATDHRLTEKTVFTEQGVIMGTPEYMSPEQAGLNALDIDMRTDVYTLGVLLYELLTGALPFSADDLRRAGYDAMCKTIREREPPRPSTKITQLGTDDVAARRRTDASTLLRRLRGDLDWIVLKCLEKDRTRRYETVSELAADVQRHLADEAVLARAPTWSYRLSKIVRRNRGQFVAAAAVLLALLVGVATTTHYWLLARTRAEEASAQAKIARDNASAAEDARGKAQEMAQMADRQRLQAEALAETLKPYKVLAIGARIDQALERVESLYPPWPEQMDAMRAWLAEAEQIAALRPEIERSLEGLRARALPATPAEIERAAREHTDYAEWQEAAARLAAARRVRDIRAGAPLHLPVPSESEEAMTPLQLRDLVDLLLDEQGQESRALALARVAWSKSLQLPIDERVKIGQLLADAWQENGKDDEAIAQAQRVAALDTRPELAAWVDAVRKAATAAGSEAENREFAQLEQRVALLTADVHERARWRFQDDADGFCHAALAGLLTRLEEEFGPQQSAVAASLSWAQLISQATTAHPRARCTWDDARTALRKADGLVASTLYRQHPIELSPQVGLVPIGMNPVTKLWEFYDLASAGRGRRVFDVPIPSFKPDGTISVHASTGIVFVLLPGGSFLMGAQKNEPAHTNFDADADQDTVVHTVTLAPFFLARHELTLGQWHHLSHEDAAVHHNHSEFAAPKGHLTWLAAQRTLQRLGMTLPSEAQWEYGCRAGTTSTWWTGNNVESLRGAANVDWDGEFDDRWPEAAPVDALRCNAFGLHHVHGNLFEWCLDAFHEQAYSRPARAGDGRRDYGELTADERVCRGGHFEDNAMGATSAYREGMDFDASEVWIGVRPARLLR